VGRRPVLVPGRVLAARTRTPPERAVRTRIIIDFRYHLVTIIGIFLALAVGIVVGTTALNGPVLEGLRRSNSGLISDKRALEGDVRSLQSEVDTADDLVRTMSDQLIGSRLADARVLLVTAPGAEGAVVEQIATTVTEAGGTVTGRLALEPELFEDESTQLVEDLVADVVPAGVELPEDSAVARAAAVLAAGLLTRSGGSGVDRDSADQVVPAFQEAGLVELSEAGDDPATATLAVLVAAPAPAEPTEQHEDVVAGLLEVASQLRAAGNGLVVAGPAESVLEGGLVRAVRSDSARDGVISTVDNADRAVGQVAVVLALREQSRGGAGRYGGGQGASGPVPTGSASPEQQPDPSPQPAPQPGG
jgi:hypothetical protein